MTDPQSHLDSLIEEEKDSLELLIRHELAMKQLYELFAEGFPDKKTFWKVIMEEEQKHADHLRDLSAKENIRKWFVTEGRFKRLAIDTSIHYINEQIEQMKKGNISLIKAFSIAHDLEESLIEKQFISLNMTGPEEVRNVMKGLVADTQRHRRIISETLNHLKSGTH